ncbi:helix-turn-helix protein [Herbihabitans rhizosphaerae]|uniref:Helix-turn-helix protein n=1 Tax=Herbihabitans rhizosphaerae TaxID=1872711 RepID=A0A4Q7L2R4_9PSEU|nr:helix-turn-helix domain-containing protein [Herbihabitans rhizosphaerae]RZS43444.1 helix-turn-helix protein [Herbihabitans rhizosphaerae]
MLRIHFGAQDMARTTIATTVDPLWETVLSLHMVQTPRPPVVFGRWRDHARRALVRQGLAKQINHTLIPITPPASYFPDFLTPAESVEGLDAGIEAIIATSDRRVRDELAMLGTTTSTTSWVQLLAQGDREARQQLGQALRAYYDVALAPHQAAIDACLEADRQNRVRAMVGGGIEQMLGGMRPLMRWEAPVLEVAYPVDRDVYLDGRGMLLVPSFFCWRMPVALADESLRPVLVYPVRHEAITASAVGGARRPKCTEEALGNLLGATRAAVLLGVNEGRTTSQLAADVKVSAATISHHTTVLRESGLIDTTRQANTVVHTLTPLGNDLVGG